MKATSVSKLARLTLATAALAVSGGIAIAAESATGLKLVPQVIELHAPNNSTPTVTIWMPERTTKHGADAAATKRDAIRVIQLPASNNSMSSVTVRTSN